MTPKELVLGVVAAGASVRRLPDGKATIFGEVPAEVMEGIRADRESFLAAWDEYRLNRYGEPPPDVLLLAPRHPVWSNDVRKLCHGYVNRQGPEVMRWLLLRAEAYGKANPEWADRHRMNAAVKDVVHWQLERYEHPEALLALLDEAYRGLRKS